MTDNRRQAPRRSLLWKVSAAARDGFSRLGSETTGYLLDLSLTGARIRIDTPYAPQTRGEVYIKRLNLLLPFQTVWRRKGEIGIRFVDSPAMQEPHFRALFNDRANDNRDRRAGLSASG